MKKVNDILSLVTPKNAEPTASCHHVLSSGSLKVSAYERNCACNYEQAELLAYKQEKFTVSFLSLWSNTLTCCVCHSHVSACPLSDSKTFFFPHSHFTALQPAECVCKCAVRLFYLGGFYVTFGERFHKFVTWWRLSTNAAFFGCVCVSLCVRERETKQDMWP